MEKWMLSCTCRDPPRRQSKCAFFRWLLVRQQTNHRSPRNHLPVCLYSVRGPHSLAVSHVQSMYTSPPHFCQLRRLGFFLFLLLSSRRISSTENYRDRLFLNSWMHNSINIKCFLIIKRSMIRIPAIKL